MKVKLKNIKSDLKKIDTHSIGESEYEELPELTAEMFDRAVYKAVGKEKQLLASLERALRLRSRGDLVAKIKKD